jgi:hypothetical protein
VVTCIALGWPTPTIGWVRNVGDLTDTRIISDSAQIHPDPAVVSAKLQWLGGFLESDAGNYTCVVQASDTDASSSKVVSIELRTEPLPTGFPVLYSVSSQEADFQVRVLDTDCEMWGEDLKTDIARDFMREVVNSVSAACQDCVVTSEDIQVNDAPTCSEGSAIFRGTVSTESSSRTQDIFCALSRWQQGMPLILINDNFSLVDSTLPLLADEATATTTDVLQNTPTFTPSSSELPLVVIVGVGVGGVAIASILIITVCCCCYVYRRKKMARYQTSSVYDQ